MNIQPIIHSLLGITCLLLVVACQPARSPSNSVRSQTKIEERSETKLTLNDAILEQANETGTTSWKIKAKSTVYSEDKKTAYLETITSNLLQNEQIVLQISGDRGTVSDNGNLILLEGNVVASDPRNNSVVRSTIIEWRPGENLLTIRDNLTASRDNLQIKAKNGQYHTDIESLELDSNAIVTTFKPALQLKSDRLTWKIPQQLVTSSTPIQIVRYRDRVITDRLVADGAALDLSKNLVTLSKNVELIATSPQLQIATDSLIWNYQTRFVTADKPIQIVDRTNRLTVTGNRGTVDLTAEIAKLQNGIQGVNQAKPAHLYAGELTWRIQSQSIEAIDNVVYQQTNPQVNLTGDKAVGNLQTNNIVVSSGAGQKQRVISTIDDK